MNLRATSAVLVCMLALARAAATTAVPEDRCVYINLSPGEARQLLPDLDGFAKANRLRVDLSHPMHASYYRYNDAGGVIALMIYYFFMGTDGAQLVLYRADPERSMDLPPAVDAFVDGVVRPHHGVESCDAVRARNGVRPRSW